MKKIDDPILEAHIISLIVNDFNCRYAFLDKLSKEDFAEHHPYREVFDAILSLQRSDRHWTISDVAELLQHKPVLYAAFENCVLAKTHGWNADACVKDLVQMRQRRDLEAVLKKALQNPEWPIQDMLSFLAQSVEEIHGNTFQAEDYSMASLIKERRRKYESGNLEFVATGYPLLDQVIGGFPVGGVTILAARTSSGKTTFICNFVLNMLQQNIPTAVFSLEVSRDKFYRKLACIKAGINPHTYKKKNLSPADHACLDQAEEELLAHKNFPVEDKDFDVYSLKEKIRYLSRRFEIKVFFIDYIGRIQPSAQHDDMYQRYGEVSRVLNNLAKELDVAIICLAQLNRNADLNPEIPPSISQIAESGKIEQDADLVLLLHRPYEQGHRLPDITDLIIGKHREEGILKTIAYQHDKGKFIEKNEVERKLGKRREIASSSSFVDKVSARYEKETDQ